MERKTLRRFVALRVWPGVSLECPVTVRLTSERSDCPARSSHGVARKRNGINPISGVPTVANPTTRRWNNIMFMIGIDPHKGSHTAAAVDQSEVVIDTIRVDANRDQRTHLLAWAAPFSPRTWAIEGATGMGALLAQQLVAAGEHVVDVPPKLSSRVRLLERGRIDKTDPNDARSAAIVAWHNPALNVVTGLDEHRVVLRLLADRDHQITANRTRTICRLHALLCLLIEGGTGKALTVTKAEELLVKVNIDGAVTLERIAAGHQLLAEIEVLDAARVEVRKRTAVVITATGTTITDIHGIGPLTAAIIIGRVGDIRRFPTAGHFARHNGTARSKRHRDPRNAIG